MIALAWIAFVRHRPSGAMPPLYQAPVETTEGTVLHPLFGAHTTSGRDARTASAIDPELVPEGSRTGDGRPT